MPWIPRALCVGLGLLLTLVVGPASATTATDSAGRVVDLGGPSQRIVCLGPGALRLIVYLRAQDKVVGVEALERDFPDGRPYLLAHPGLAKLPVIGPGGVAAIGRLPDMEALLTVRPQVIFATYMHPSTAERLQSMSGAKVVLLDYGPFASVEPRTLFASLRVAGAVLGRQQRAEEVIAYAQSCLDDLARRAAGAPDVGPVYVGGIGFKGVQGIDSSDAEYAPFRWLGLPNAAKGSGAKGHCFMDREQLLKADPPTIFMDVAGLSLLAGDFAKRPQYYQSLRAFRDGRVFLLHPFNWYTTNLGTALADAYAIGRALWPQRFADARPDQKADEIYQHLVGAPVHGAMTAKYGPLGGRAPFLKGQGQ